jgi:hypothetical protein
VVFEKKNNDFGKNRVLKNVKKSVRKENFDRFFFFEVLKKRRI